MSFSFPRKLIFRVLTLVLKISRIGCNWLKPREGGLCAVRGTADRGKEDILWQNVEDFRAVCRGI